MTRIFHSHVCGAADAVAARLVLNELGIVSFRQIADLNGQRMLMVATWLKTFLERIVRDGWMKQARALHLEKHGEEPAERASIG